MLMVNDCCLNRCMSWEREWSELQVFTHVWGDGFIFFLRIWVPHGSKIINQRYGEQCIIKHCHKCRIIITKTRVWLFKINNFVSTAQTPRVRKYKQQHNGYMWEYAVIFIPHSELYPSRQETGVHKNRISDHSFGRHIHNTLSRDMGIRT